MISTKSSISCFSRFTLFASFLVIISCSQVKIVTIKNSTDEPIEFRSQFKYKQHEPYNLDFSLNPGNVDSWKYKTGYLEKSLDQGLKKIILKNNKGCKVILERDMIEKIATKDGMWEINIDKEMMNCN